MFDNIVTGFYQENSFYRFYGSKLAIIDIPNVTILNHTADTNRNADIPSRESHLTCSGMNNGL